MANFPNLENPPITEAVIEFSVDPIRDDLFLKLDGFYKSIKSEYPTRQKRHKHKIESRFDKLTGKATTVTKDLEFDRYVLKSSNQIEVVQVNGFKLTYSRLKPYSRWEIVLERAKNIWENYIEHLKPQLITKISVRYINHIEISDFKGNYNEYLKAPPSKPNIEGLLIDNFFTKIQLIRSDISATLTQATNSSKQTKQTIILDIDVKKDHSYDITDDEIWSDFGDLRNLKNEIFFESITEKGLELFK